LTACHFREMGTARTGGRLTSPIAAGESRRSYCWCQLTGFPFHDRIVKCEPRGRLSNGGDTCA